MGKSPRKKPRLPKANPKAEEEPKSDPAPINISSDEEADYDLSLKIVEKAMLRASGKETNTNPALSYSKPEEITTEVKKKTKKRKEKMGARDNAVEEPKSDPASNILRSNDPSSSSSKPEEVVNKKMKKRKERKKEKMVLQDNAADDVEMKEEDATPKDSDVTLETNPAEKSDNIVLRKLLRGPRYFDPPDNNWGNCYNCGEGGHITANCTSARRKKPCFVCGSLDHNAKQCNKGKDCFICKKSGHRAKDCPEKSNWGSQNAKICLKCGDSGHEMYTCKSMYSPDDLKEIQCYICKCFGHLCCVSYPNDGPREVSCYRCGQLGHSGWECARVHAETTSNNGTPSSCYKCGQDGHVARKCTTSTKKEKRKSDYSSPRKSHSRDNNHHNHVGARSVPHDYHKKSKSQYGQPTSSQSTNNKPRSRGGWITEDPGDWESPKHQDRYNKSHERFHSHSHNNSGGSGYSSGYHSNSKGRKLHYESGVGSNGYQHRFSASRFGNSSNFGKRDYSWDY